MNKSIANIGKLVVLMVVSMATAANAQTMRSPTEIPFDFVIGQKWHAAGQYDVTILNSKMMTIADKSGETIFAAALSTNAAVLGTNGTKLVFNRYEDRYFLNKVVSSNFGLKLSMSSDEQALTKNRGMQIETLSLKTK